VKFKRNTTAYVRVALQELINPQIARLIEEGLAAEATAISAIQEGKYAFQDTRKIAARIASNIANRIAERGFPNEAPDEIFA
jgi:hypothetical protein